MGRDGCHAMGFERQGASAAFPDASRGFTCSQQQNQHPKSNPPAEGASRGRTKPPHDGRVTFSLARATLRTFVD